MNGLWFDWGNCDYFYLILIFYSNWFLNNLHPSAYPVLFYLFCNGIVSMNGHYLVSCYKLVLKLIIIIIIILFIFIQACTLIVLLLFHKCVLWVVCFMSSLFYVRFILVWITSWYFSYKKILLTVNCYLFIFDLKFLLILYLNSINKFI